MRGREVLRERVCGGGEASRAAVLLSEPMGVRCGIMSAQDCAARSAECAPRGVLRKRIYGYGAEAIPALIQVGKYINTGKTRVRRMKERARQGSFERAGLRGRRGEPRCRIVKRADKARSQISRSVQSVSPRFPRGEKRHGRSRVFSLLLYAITPKE